MMRGEYREDEEEEKEKKTSKNKTHTINYSQTMNRIRIE